ncbi:hypothetical protein [Myxosarcina sp. GI1(2024)]
MNRQEIEKVILSRHPELLATNLKNLKKTHLESWLEHDEITISSATLVKIFLERNERAEINQRLNRENFGLVAKLGAITKWTKNEFIQSFKHLFGKVTKDDDKILSEIDAVSKETAREDLEKAETVVNDSKNIAQQYRNKYGKL